MEKIDLNLRPEFTYELVLGIPYANYLQSIGRLGKVNVCIGMRPYYFFADEVNEVFTNRTVDNKKSGILDLPNDWLHHNAVSLTGKDYSELTEQEKVEVNGVLDYKEWLPPDYTKAYDGSHIDMDKLIVINNQFNVEKLRFPTRFFSIECLFNMFYTLTQKGYTIVYNRPENTEFIIDENEVKTLKAGLKLEALVEGHGIMSDYDLAEQVSGVYNFKQLWKKSGMSYNEFQLNLYAKAVGFIGVVGGAGTLAAYYKKPTVLYATVSRAIADGYFSEDSYYQKLSDGNVHPIVDKREDQLKRGGNDYTELLEKINELF